MDTKMTENELKSLWARLDRHEEYSLKLSAEVYRLTTSIETLISTIRDDKEQRKLTASIENLIGTIRDDKEQRLHDARCIPPSTRTPNPTEQKSVAWSAFTAVAIAIGLAIVEIAKIWYKQ